MRINFISNAYKSGSILADLLDHCPIYINIKTVKPGPFFIKVNFFDYFEQSLDGFVSDLCGVAWVFERFGTVSEMYRFFNQNVQNCFHRTFQLKRKCCQRQRLLNLGLLLLY